MIKESQRKGIEAGVGPLGPGTRDHGGRVFTSPKTDTEGQTEELIS